MKKTRTSLKGRKCKHPGCSHILSIYNHEGYCHVHLSQEFEIPKLKQEN
ncbi:MAG: hypothetical protein NTY14_03150 [Candidatus Omnitrophica bacterium]|nr:hypothetical protein [Candidatus Omnitrophota bacterium]